MYVLSVSGMYSHIHTTPEVQMADMLRYDDGELISVKTEPIPGLKSHKRYTATVHTNNYTPERWKSFGINTQVVEKTKGTAGSKFETQQDVAEFSLKVEERLMKKPKKKAIKSEWHYDREFREIFLDEWYERTPDTYNSAYEQCNQVGNEMLRWLKNKDPEYYEILYQYALKEKTKGMP